MKNILEKFKSISENDFLEHKVDLHIHTKFSDGEGDYLDILNSAKNKKYKFIAITDHNSVEVHKLINDDILISGVEFDCWFGYVFIHLLAYGIDVENDEIKSFLSNSKIGTENCIIRLFSRRNVKKLIQAIHSAGGIAVLAHPACYWAFSMENLIKRLIDAGLDGIELYYPYSRFRKYVKFHSENEVYNIVQKYPQLIKTGGTDFHGKNF